MRSDCGDCVWEMRAEDKYLNGGKSPLWTDMLRTTTYMSSDQQQTIACLRCGRTFKCLDYYGVHVRGRSTCPARAEGGTGVTKADLLAHCARMRDNVSIAAYECRKCGRGYATRRGRINHERACTAVGLAESSVAAEVREQCQALRQQLGEVMQELATIKEQQSAIVAAAPVVATSITNNNTASVTNNTTNNITINVFGHEDLSHLSPDDLEFDILASIEGGAEGFASFTGQLHFDPRAPCNRNVRYHYPSVEDDDESGSAAATPASASYYDGVGWRNAEAKIAFLQMVFENALRKIEQFWMRQTEIHGRENVCEAKALAREDLDKFMTEVVAAGGASWEWWNEEGLRTAARRVRGEGGAQCAARRLFKELHHALLEASRAISSSSA